MVRWKFVQVEARAMENDVVAPMEKYAEEEIVLFKQKVSFFIIVAQISIVRLTYAWIVYKYRHSITVRALAQVSIVAFVCCAY